MAEIAINPTHNVFKKYKEVIYVNPFLATPPVVLPVANTFIGGVASTLYTPALLAAKLAIDVSRISAFEVVGSDIKCSITGNYVIPSDCFKSNNSITHYKDLDGLVTELIKQTFFSAVNLTDVYFPECTRIDFNNYLSFYQTIKLTDAFLPKVQYINTQTFQSSNALKTLYLPELINVRGPYAFANMQSIEVIDIKKCILLSDPSYRNTFDTIKLGCVLNVNVFLKTNNAGGVDGDLTYAKNTRSAIVNFYDNSGNYHSTL